LLLARLLNSAFLAFDGLAGLVLPNDPWNLFPFAVFLSPLPMIIFFMNAKNRKTPAMPGF
jgi:hypothetical protein